MPGRRASGSRWRKPVPGPPRRATACRDTAGRRWCARFGFASRRGDDVCGACDFSSWHESSIHCHFCHDVAVIAIAPRNSGAVRCVPRFNPSRFLLFVAGVGLRRVGPGSGDDGAVRSRRITAQEEADTLAALKPPKRQRPVVAVLGLNEGSETTDYLVPFGVLRRSGARRCVRASIRPGPVTLMPSLTIVPDMTAAEFDQRFPEGADYVIVPAMHVADDRGCAEMDQRAGRRQSNRRGRVRRRTRARERRCAARQARNDALVSGKRTAQD